MFSAHDKMTGEGIFEYKLSANPSGIPAHMVKGRQYILVAVGVQGVPAERVALVVS